MAETWVEIVHPKIEGSEHLVTAGSFERLHEKKGWVLANAPKKSKAKKASAEASEDTPEE